MQKAKSHIHIALIALSIVQHILKGCMEMENEKQDAERNGKGNEEQSQRVRKPIVYSMI